MSVMIGIPRMLRIPDLTGKRGLHEIPGQTGMPVMT